MAARYRWSWRDADPGVVHRRRSGEVGAATLGESSDRILENEKLRAGQGPQRGNASACVPTPPSTTSQRGQLRCLHLDPPLDGYLRRRRHRPFPPLWAVETTNEREGRLSSRSGSFRRGVWSAAAAPRRSTRWRQDVPAGKSARGIVQDACPQIYNYGRFGLELAAPDPIMKGRGARGGRPGGRRSGCGWVVGEQQHIDVAIGRAALLDAGP